MLVWVIHFMLLSMLVLGKELIREDHLHCRVPKFYTATFMFCTVFLRLCFLYALGYRAQNFIAESFLSCLRGLVLIVPLLVMYRIRKIPGPADIKYCFCIAFLLKTAEAYLLLIMASLWAACMEFLRRKHQPQEVAYFAFLPYLISSTLPFLFMNYWTLGGLYAQSK